MPMTLQQIRENIESEGLGWKAEDFRLSEVFPEGRHTAFGVAMTPDEVASAVTGMAQRSRTIAAFSIACTSIDWRQKDGKNYVAPVKDQSACGSCVAFGCVATVESNLLITGQVAM